MEHSNITGFDIQYTELWEKFSSLNSTQNVTKKCGTCTLVITSIATAKYLPICIVGLLLPLWITQLGLITVTAIKLFRTVIYEGPDTILVNTRNSHFKWPNKHL